MNSIIDFANEQTTVKMFYESNSIINSTSEQTIVKMLYTILRWKQKNWKMSIQFIYIYRQLINLITYRTITLLISTIDHSIKYETISYMIISINNYLIEIFDRSFTWHFISFFDFRYFSFCSIARQWKN